MNEEERKEKLARSSYDVYGRSVDYKNYQGLPMPTFEQLPEPIKMAWIDASSHAYDIGRIVGEQNKENSL